MSEHRSTDTQLEAPSLQKQAVSVTRKLSASLPNLRRIAADKGLKIHHLGAGYPHPEVSDPRSFLQHKERFYAWLTEQESLHDGRLPEFLRECYSYSDTLGPLPVREHFAKIYGRDWGIDMSPQHLLPTLGATGGIAFTCSLFEHTGEPLAYLTDAPTYAGFVARAKLAPQAKIFSVEMDDEGPIIENMAKQIRAARDEGRFVPLYYTTPDGHNPAGFSFSDRRRREILDLLRTEGILILEDAPYIYISFVEPEQRPTPFLGLDPKQTIHLFTGSKIGFPGPRVGFIYSEATLAIEGGEAVPLTDLLLIEASADLLFPNPESLYGFDALLHDEHMALRDSLWPVAESKLAVYRENRQIMLDGLSKHLAGHEDRFEWTSPMGGFFVVFRFKDAEITTDDEFCTRLVTDHGLVVTPMYEFYPQDARQRQPRIGLDELRLSFCFTESFGDQRRQDLTESVEAFCAAVKSL